MQNLTELYINMNKLVYAFVYEYTSDVEVANEVTASVWLKVVKNPERYLKMGPHHLKNYLKVMVRTAYADYYKVQKKAETSTKELEILGANDVRNLNFVEDEVFFVDNVLYLRKAIKGLDKEELELLTLKFDNNLKWREIAEVYNVSEGSIRTKQSRIYKKLREEILCMIENDEVFEDEQK